MKNKTLRTVILITISIISILSVTIFTLEFFSNYKVTKTIHNDAPVITKKSIVINAPIEKVWAIFCSIEVILSMRYCGPFSQSQTYTIK